MAARRFTGSKVNWSKLTALLVEEDRASFTAFKAKHDGYLRKVSSLPEAPPKIDFASFKSKIPNPALVDQFQKQYEALQIPYPTDTFTNLINDAEKKELSETQAFIAESNKRIEEYKKQIEDEESLIPITEMTLQEFSIAYPEEAFNPEKPTFWPHTPDHQITAEDLDYWEKRKKNLVGDDH